MAFASDGFTISDQTKTSSATWAPTTSDAYFLGRLIVLMVATDNDAAATADAETNRHLSIVVNPGGLTFTKAKEWTRGAGAAAGGATVSVWYLLPASSILTASLTFTFAAAVAAKAYTGWMFTRDTAKTVGVAGAAGLASATSDPAISLSGLAASTQYLWVMARGCETSAAASFTATSGWTAVNDTSTSGGSANTNVRIIGEFLISTATTQTSDPTTALGAIDEASVLVAFNEVASSSTYTKAGYAKENG